MRKRAFFAAISFFEKDKGNQMSKQKQNNVRKAGLRGFTLGMLIGIVVGTYSSIAIAAPILIIGKIKKNKGK